MEQIDLLRVLRREVEGGHGGSLEQLRPVLCRALEVLCPGSRSAQGSARTLALDAIVGVPEPKKLPGTTQPDRTVGASKPKELSGIRPSDEPSGVPTAEESLGLSASERPTRVPETEETSGISAIDEPSGIPTTDGASGVQASHEPLGVPASDEPSGVPPVQGISRSTGAVSDLKLEQEPRYEGELANVLESGWIFGSDKCPQNGVAPESEIPGSATGLLGDPRSMGALEPTGLIESGAFPGAGHSPQSLGVIECAGAPLSLFAIASKGGLEAPSVPEPRNQYLIVDVEELQGPKNSCRNQSFPDQASLVLCTNVAQALYYHAAPKGGSAEERSSDSAVPKRARAAGSIIIDLLRTLRKGEPGHENGAKDAFPEGGEAPERQESNQALWTPPSSLASLVYVFARTHCDEKPWTDKESQARAEDVLEVLLQALDCGSIAELLRGRREGEHGLLRDIMGLLIPELKKDAWEQNPATKHVFAWTLQQVTRPWLCDYLDRVLPPSLLISDDYRMENKILGVNCLHHIILNVPAAELLQFNRAQVVYHALYNHLYTPEADLIQVVLSCLLDLLPVLERFPQVTREPTQRSRYSDDVLQLILTHMEMEHRILLRRVYAKHLPAFVERLGIGVAYHLKRMERVFVGYLEMYDGPEEEARLSTLASLKFTIMHAWPRMPCRLGTLLKALLRMIYDVATDCSLTPENVKSALLHEATDCLILLDRCSQRQVKVLLEGISRTCTEGQVLKCLEKVQQDV